MDLILCLVVAIAVCLASLILSRCKNRNKGVHCSDAECFPPEMEQGPSREELDAAHKLALDPCASGMPVMYTLHTCLHCAHLKVFLEERGIEHKLIYVDDFDTDVRREVMEMVRHFNPRGSFPTLVLPDRRVVVGFRQRLVCEALGLES